MKSRGVHDRPVGPLPAPAGPAPSAPLPASKLDALESSPPPVDRSLPSSPAPAPTASDAGSLIAVRAGGGDVNPIGTARALALTLGIESGFQSRIPARHLRWLSAIKDLRAELVALPDEALKARFSAVKDKLAKGASRQSMLPEAFALVREVSRRTLGKEHYEVQLLAGMAIVDRNVAQLKTGEGKTLCAALAASLFAADGKGCHVATTNSYLAARDAEELRPLYAGLGMTVGVTKSNGQTYDEKRAAYACDITYGHADTFAFDWLEDQTWWKREWRVQRGLHAAIVDEADDVLLDTALQPLVLCGAAEGEESFEVRKKTLRLADTIAQGLQHGVHVEVDHEKEKLRPRLTDEGVTALEQSMREQLGLKDSAAVWQPEQLHLLGAILKALEARYSVVLGKDYIEQEAALTLVSQGTGHPSPGARLRHGLMDSVLMQEGKDPEPELSTIGIISYQAFFNSYPHLGGMTGTARGGKDELRDLYGLPVIEVPTHLPVKRVDEPDRLFPHPAPRLLAATADVLKTQAAGQPVLVSTVSVTASRHVSARLKDPVLCLADVAISSDRMMREAASRLRGGAELIAQHPSPTDDKTRAGLHAGFKRLLDADPKGTEALAAFLESRGLPAKTLLEHRQGVAHRVLNAETHAEEAEIIGRAGAQGAVTVATQMAGRGVDIPISEAVEALGGLAVIGIERKTNARKDDQARGRSGRKGQAGVSRFYVSPADEVFTYLPAHLLRDLASRLGTEKIGEPSPALRRSYEGALRRAQDRSERSGEQQRRIGMKLDGTVELQRRTIRKWREEILDHSALSAEVGDWLRAELDRRLEGAPKPYAPEAVKKAFANLDPDAPELLARPMTPAEVHGAFDAIVARRSAKSRETAKQDGPAFEQWVRDTILFTLDQAWVEHLQEQEHRKTTAYLYAFAGKDPFVEHSISASRDFGQVIAAVKRQVAARFEHQLKTSG